ncbi:MAG TPA: GGDEF domain-containing protein [Mycobacteriales bacterium]|nr:GGDEF domain-containing protein [Mycobacteriales bacterium]
MSELDASAAPPADLVLATMPQLLLAIDNRGRIVFETLSARRLHPGTLVATPLIDVVVVEDRPRLAQLVLAACGQPGSGARGRLRFRMHDGPPRHLDVVLYDHAHNPDGLLHLHAWDITDLACELETIRHRALHDPLTGLANRALFLDRLCLELRRRRRTRTPLAVLYGDVDAMKQVNDRFGHAAGDELLTRLAGRLTSHLRAADTAARLGGDEFAILCPDLAAPADAHLLAGRLVTALAEPMLFDDQEVFVTFPVGIALADDADPDDGAALLQRADLAMYRHKREQARGSGPKRGT